MAVQKKFALGRGLDALISTEEVKTAGSSSINEIELSKISVNPNQPRREFDPVALQELADSIAEIGIIQPITLRQLSEDSYQIIAGERRYRASIQAGLKSIPAYIRTADDENVMEMALIENIQREDLNSTFIGTICIDTGTAERTCRKKTYHYRQLSASAETSGSDSSSIEKPRNRHGTRPCLIVLR